MKHAPGGEEGGTAALVAAGAWRHWQEHSGSERGAPADAAGSVSSVRMGGGEHQQGVGDHPQAPPVVAAAASSDHGLPADSAGDVSGKRQLPTGTADSVRGTFL